MDLQPNLSIIINGSPSNNGSANHLHPTQENQGVTRVFLQAIDALRVNMYALEQEELAKAPAVCVHLQKKDAPPHEKMSASKKN